MVYALMKLSFLKQSLSSAKTFDIGSMSLMDFCGLQDEFYSQLATVNRATAALYM